jgi:hypothetical protein
VQVQNPWHLFDDGVHAFAAMTSPVEAEATISPHPWPAKSGFKLEHFDLGILELHPTVRADQVSGQSPILG